MMTRGVAMRINGAPKRGLVGDLRRGNFRALRPQLRDFLQHLLPHFTFGQEVEGYFVLFD
jgi:hypothetical protein